MPGPTATRRKPAQRLGDLFARLGGGSPSVLNDVTGARPHFVRTGVTMCAMATVSAVSMAATLHLGLRLPAAAAIPGGLVWGDLIILGSSGMNVGYHRVLSR